MKRLLLFLTVLAGAPGGAFSEPEAAPTDFRSDLCAVCGMPVTNRSYAAQIVGPGKPVFFDDIGCLVQYERSGKVPAGAPARFVRSVAGDAWLRVEKAFWVLTKDVRTPMGYGLHAFPDAQSADTFAQGRKGAKVLAWKDVPGAVPAGKDPM